jgi:hypothetical protein
MKKFEPNHIRIDVDMCDIIKYGEESMVFKFISGLYGYVKDLLHACPYEKVLFCCCEDCILGFK